MCGIVGFTGKGQAAPVLLDGLAKLEYRGYDSAGIAVKRDDSNRIEIVKVKGRLKQLSEKTDSGRTVPGCCGIGHTRWATHGEPSMVNAHPHCSDDQSVIVVHNGIIENYLELKEKLAKNGYEFYSQTDTEVLTKLLDYYYKKYQGNTLEAITKVMLRVRGSYALGIMLKKEPGVIYAVRKDSPLIVGRNEQGCFIASDVPAILKYSRNVYYIDNLEIARLTESDAAFYNIDREEVVKEPVEIKWDAEAAEKGGFEHFMMKEIHEQPKAVRDTIGSYVKDGRIDLSSVGLSDEEIRDLSRLYIVACGSAYHVGIAAKYVMEDLAKLPVEVDLASEFRYRDPILEKDALVVIISQSGETADSLAALREAKSKGARTI
ncbi:MAG: glutamine--fructose-6-phosphate transaminase (isomerizing), partial [Lachnospiraceae bacterium]|nr:glutamine--fructose-6-phosphate transaminase (isomerizing) [Lachnospiraceae bacterium]